MSRTPSAIVCYKTCPQEARGQRRGAAQAVPLVVSFAWDTGVERTRRNWFSVAITRTLRDERDRDWRPTVNGLVGCDQAPQGFVGIAFEATPFAW